jgi:hypothetical protein
MFVMSPLQVNGLSASAAMTIGCVGRALSASWLTAHLSMAYVSYDQATHCCLLPASVASNRD